MATRQYIGARYVPKFYQNSVDGSTAWEANVVYEPLIYVTLQNGHMYISKKQVPATVGTPATNIDYWLDVGDYNGFIEQLQDEIDDLDALTAKLSALTLAENRKFMFYGDSYGETYVRDGVTITGWLDKIAPILGVPSAQVGGSAISGYGFCGSNNQNRWYDLLDNATVDADVTDCCFIGGTNDVSYAESSTFVNTVEMTIALAKTKYPNARIWVGFCSLGSNDIVTTHRLAAAGAYSKEATKHGAIFMDSLQYCLYNPANYGSAHPNNNGTTIMAAAISSILKGGTYENVMPPTAPIEVSDASVTPNTLTGSMFFSTHDNQFTLRYKGVENNRCAYRLETPMDYVATGNSSIILGKYSNMPVFSQKVILAQIPVLSFWQTGGIIPAIATLSYLNGYFVVTLLASQYGAANYYNADHADRLNGFDFSNFVAKIDMLRDSID